MLRMRWIALFSLFAACGGSDGGGGVDGPPGGGDGPAGGDAAIGVPIEAPEGVWTWADVPGAVCNDGTPTGVAVNRGSSDDLLFFLNGGGACWDAVTCLTLGTATTGPIGRPQFEAAIAGVPAGTLFDRDAVANPFRDYSYVFVPYCTGDLHGGDRVATYDAGSGAVAWHHVGRTNVLADLARVVPTFPTVDKLVVAGSSAGGGGAVLMYDEIRGGWPTSTGYLIDDSLPLFLAADFPAVMRDAFFAEWHLGGAVDAECGDCAADLSHIYGAIGRAFPDDRRAFLTLTVDTVVRQFFQQTEAEFTAAMNRVNTGAMGPAGFESFIDEGAGHVLLFAPANYVTGEGVDLNTWLGQMVTDDAEWTSVAP